MRRPDHPPTAPNGLPLLCPKVANPPGHHGGLEPRPAAHLFGDPGEEPASSWEAAWIDLGGEG